MGKRGGCIHCGKNLVIEPGQGTSALKRHLQCCPLRPPDFSEDRKYDPKVDREMLSDTIIYHDFPFRYVEYEKVRAIDKYLNPNVQHICRQTVGADAFRRYEVEKGKLKKILAEHKGRVCFTADLWSARTTIMRYICLTAHYIDDSWRLNNKILAFCEMKSPYIGEEIAYKVLGCMKEWVLEKKVFSITLDNANNNDSMQRILQHRLQMITPSGLLCDGDFFHVRCCAHIMNLIVKQGLELVNDLVENIRDSVKFFKASGSRIEAFAACVEIANISSGAGLSLDVPTRWNSTYDMLARALRSRKAFSSLKICDRNYKSLPSEDEWERGEKICDLLKPFSTITTYFYGVKYPTANVYFIQVWKIETLLMKYSNCGDINLELLARTMKAKFDKYWEEYNVILAMGVVLDPRLKLQILKSAYDKIDPTTSKEKIRVVKENLKLLYEEYKTKPWTSLSSMTQTLHELHTESPLEDDMNYDLFELERNIDPSSDNARSNLDIYLDEPRLEMKSFADIDVLNFWKDNGQRYGDLVTLARDVLSIPITTVASESAFSIGGRVLSPFRNRLLPKNVQALLCTRNWLRGYADFEGDIEEFFDDEKEDSTKTASASRTWDLRYLV